jgi:hypothetical protein
LRIFGDGEARVVCLYCQTFGRQNKEDLEGEFERVVAGGSKGLPRLPVTLYLTLEP